MFEQKKFVKPTADLISFEDEDIILTSGEQLGDPTDVLDL